MDPTSGAPQPWVKPRPERRGGRAGGERRAGARAHSLRPRSPKAGWAPARGAPGARGPRFAGGVWGAHACADRCWAGRPGTQAGGSSSQSSGFPRAARAPRSESGRGSSRGRGLPPPRAAPPTGAPRPPDSSSSDARAASPPGTRAGATGPQGALGSSQGSGGVRNGRGAGPGARRATQTKKTIIIKGREVPGRTRPVLGGKALEPSQ